MVFHYLQKAFFSKKAPRTRTLGDGSEAADRPAVQQLPGNAGGADDCDGRKADVVQTVLAVVHGGNGRFSFGDFHLHLYGQRTVHPQHHAVENARLCGRISPALHWADSFCLP